MYVEAWHRSDVTQREYCAKNGLAEWAFYRWRRKEKDALAAGNAALTLVPVSVGMPATGSLVVLYSPGGRRIEVPVGTASWLADFVRQLP